MYEDNLNISHIMRFIKKLQFTREAGSAHEHEAMEIIIKELKSLDVEIKYDHFTDWWIEPEYAYVEIMNQKINVKPVVPLPYLKGYEEWTGVSYINVDIKAPLTFINVQNNDKDISFVRAINTVNNHDDAPDNVIGQLLFAEEKDEYIPYLLAKSRFIPTVYIKENIINDFKELVGHECKISWKAEYKIKDFNNLIVTVKGNENKDDTILIGAHIDSFPGTVGASDNCAGAAILVEMVKYFSQYKPAKTLEFIFFTGEELDRRGSISYVKRNVYPTNLPIIYINVDSGVERGSSDTYIRATADKAIDLANLNFSNMNILAEKTSGADVEPFQNIGIPTFWACSNSPQRSHLPTDIIEDIDIEKLSLISNITLEYTISAILNGL